VNCLLISAGSEAARTGDTCPTSSDSARSDAIKNERMERIMENTSK